MRGLSFLCFKIRPLKPVTIINFYVNTVLFSNIDNNIYNERDQTTHLHAYIPNSHI